MPVIYKEWIYTVRNWKSVALAIGFAALIIMSLGSGSDVSGPYLFVPLAIALTLVSTTTGRVEADLRDQVGAIYLRTRISPFQIMLTKWGFDSALGLATACAVLVFLGLRGRTFATGEIGNILLAPLVLTAFALILDFSPTVGRALRALTIFPVFLLQGDVQPAVRVFGYFLPPLGALLGLKDAVIGEASIYLPLLLAAETAAVLAILGSRYHHLLVSRL